MNNYFMKREREDVDEETIACCVDGQFEFYADGLLLREK